MIFGTNRTNSFWKISAGLLFIALFLRTAALLSLHDSIYFNYILLDERIYHNWAVQLMNNTWSSSSIYEFPPLPAYFMAAIYTLFSPDIFWIRIANIVFGVLTCLFVGLVGRELGGKRVALYSMALSAVYAPFILYSVVPMKTAMSIFLFSLFMWIFMMAMNKRCRWNTYLFLGIIAGLMINVRGNYIVVIPVALVLIIFDCFYKRVSYSQILSIVLILAAGFILSVAPFSLRNYLVSGNATFTLSQAGFNLYLGNNPENDVPYYRPVSFASSSPFSQSTHFNIEASRRVGIKLSAQEASTFWTHEVLRYAMDNPLDFLKKIFLKTLILFNQFEAGDHYNISFLSQFVPFFQLPMLGIWIILPLAAAGLASGLFKDRKIFACATILCIYGLSLIAFHCNTRYRLPMLVLLIPIAAHGCQIVHKNLTEKKTKPVFLSAAVIFLFLIIEFLPVPGVGDMTAYQNIYALILNSSGRTREAKKYWTESSQTKGSFSDYANLSLAQYNLDNGDVKNALSYLQKIYNHSFAASSKNEKMGDIYIKEGKRKTAIDCYRKSLEINSAQKRVWKKLISNLNKTSKNPPLKEIEEFRYILSFYRE